jgi:hypothetical protein
VLVVLDESDSDLVLPMTRQVEQKISDALATNRIMVLNGRSSEGNILQQAAFVQDYVVPVMEPSTIRFVFDVASRQLVIDTPTPYRFLIAGDGFFLASILREFLVVRDKGMFLTDTFAFIFLPLTARGDRFQEEFSTPLLMFAGPLNDRVWFSIFEENSSEQNVAAVVAAKLDFIMTAPLVKHTLIIGDVLVTNITSQSVVPMFFDLTIGEYLRGGGPQAMKGTFFDEGTKTLSMKFHHLSLAIINSVIVVVWRVMSNLNALTPDTSLERCTSEKKLRDGSKVMLSLKKGQQPLTIQIDGTEYKDVVGITVTTRDPRMALNLSVPTPDQPEDA